MQKQILGYLICPVCHGETLTLKVRRQNSKEILEGIINCDECKRKYLISDGIPYIAPDDIMDEMLASKEKDVVQSGDEDLGRVVTIANIRFHNKAADIYEKDLSTKGVFTKYSQKRIEEAVRYQRRHSQGELFLDMGCGTGNVLRFGKKFFETAIGMDISVSMLMKSKEKGLDVMAASCINTPYCNGIADAISAFSVLHHLFDPRAFFIESYRLLKKGGCLYTDWDPNAEAVECVKKSFLAKAGKKMYEMGLNWVIGKDRKKTSFHTSSKSLESLSSLAEYHHHYTNGLYKKELKTWLEDLGFREILIIQHWNASSFQKDRLGDVPLHQKMIMYAKMGLTQSFNREALAPNLMILARK